MLFADAYRNRKVFVTGDTGFKGSWLCEWLIALGAEVTGYALPPATIPSLFNQLNLASRIRHIDGDVRDLTSLQTAINAAQPDYLFHLAAQPLVLLSYAQPVETYATNVMGTVNVLEALRQSGRTCNIIAVTTDKCYENREWVSSYREDDPLGGYDPYSSSKGAAELVISAYRRSYFNAADSPVRLASARAGNVIGGGDWSIDRIVPDCIRALLRNEVIAVRNKTATRPWQHVLEPLSGYLWLAAALSRTENSAFRSPANVYSSAFNFGPALNSNRTVAELVQEILRHWPGQWRDESDPHAAHEASLLNLATDKAHHLLGWQPVWNFSETIARTVSWYGEAEAGKSIVQLTRQQIDSYIEAAQTLRVAWTC
jgi:CDP-glucose 4,6-dehydratase